MVNCLLWPVTTSLPQSHCFQSSLDIIWIWHWLPTFSWWRNPKPKSTSSLWNCSSSQAFMSGSCMESRCLLMALKNNNLLTHLVASLLNAAVITMTDFPYSTKHLLILLLPVTQTLYCTSFVNVYSILPFISEPFAIKRHLFGTLLSFLVFVELRKLSNNKLVIKTT